MAVDTLRGQRRPALEPFGVEAQPYNTMAKYLVSCTVIYNGTIEVEANDEQQAIDKVDNMLCGENLDGFPDEVTVCDGNFVFGEATADYADEL